MSANTQIVESFWLARPSTSVAPDLLGCTLVRQFPDGEIIRGMIVETEAYAPGDPACHAYRQQTLRNQAMFGRAGIGYVYFIYGMYHCFNVVTDAEGVGSAVLIRALQLDAPPVKFAAIPEKKQLRLAAGPGKLCKVLEIDRTFSGLPLDSDQALRLEHRSVQFQEAIESGTVNIVQTTRIGISQGMDLPWRWYIGNCAAVSTFK
ncbi:MULTISPECIES: DNA-3-methyladenine glycosylase [unclassified Microcoleus]|uniref:DNA-3-methyladenine glycosylase n=1 Tax=unclassified Microcoleus TaxID=2642155 RepID=UPI0025F7F10A|nr:MULTISPECIES: DNA-3-methyladenine glycosylase [unclassified Microcoleus]